MCSTYDDYASLEKDVCDRVVYQCAVTKELADQLVPALPYEELLAYCRIQNYLVLRFEVQGIWYVKVISNYVEIKEIVVYMAENSQAMAKICIYYDEVNVKTDEITLFEVKYLDNNFADKYGLSFYHDEEAWGFFTKWLEWQYQIADQNKHFIYNKIGWQENGKISPFVLDQGYATVNGQIMECANMSCATPVAFTAVGSCSDWLKGVQKHVLGHQMLEIALAISLAAPLFPLVNPILSPIWCFVGNSTTGKTTALKLALSVWCSPAKADGSL